MSTGDTLSPGSVPVAIGQVLAGKYRVDRILGVGGMGIVVAATHLQLDQKVALKFMLPQGLEHPAFVERFSREARAAVRLKSDHVARVLDVGTLETGSPFMVMEYLEGDDLGAVIEKHGPMSVPAAVDCVLQACDAVAEAHALGIVHRDLKPRNLFLTTRNDGRALVKVLDFGISKAKGAGDLSLTRTTEVIGSPNYMSPEQLKSSKSADERSDIWALGVILYELLTGQVPFLAESVTQLTAMVLTEMPRAVHLLRPEVPQDLGRTIERCLEKDPVNRFRSVAELALALQPYAPPDTRDLALRIARIAGVSQLPPAPMATPSDARIAVTGGTSVNWSGRTELATTRSKRVAVGVSIGGMLAVGAAVAVAFVMKRGPHEATGAASVTSMSTVPSVVASAMSSAAPSASSTLAAIDPVPPSASAVASATPAASSTTSTPPAGRPTGRPGAAAGPSPGATPAGSGLQGPSYRTSW